MDVATLRTFIETELEDDALQTFLTAAEEDIAKILGPVVGEPAVEIVEYLPGGFSLLRLPRPADPAEEITITEYPDLSYEVERAADDWRLDNDGEWITRLDTGTTPAAYWAVGPVKVAYTPLTEQASRDRVTVALVKLDVGMQDPMLTGENIDGYGYQKAANSAFNYQTAREALLASLSPATFTFA